MRAKCVISPGARVYVQQFKLSVARIELEFNLNQAVIVNVAQKAAGKRLEGRQIDGFHEGAGASEIVRMLAPAPRDHAADSFAVLEERAKTELLAPIAWNHVLDEHFASPCEFAGAAEHEMQLGTRVNAPSFCFCGVKEMFFDCGL